MFYYTEESKKALKFLLKAHEGQSDKSGMPYFLHTIMVANQMYDGTSTTVALLHDVIEDTAYTEQDLLDMGFSQVVVDTVQLLTHDNSVPYMEYIQTIKENEIARRVKLADLQHNMDTSRFDDEIPQKVLDKIKMCYEPACRILSDAE